ncbi:A/G-specific adenine glycosylase [Mucilaginibacter sp. RS28]|uniref:Adenine DNA glycosylase n=1 Tax=Mucilaginibacter straminoryzae TaxID=2932774 RepID=A0A9X1X2F8_9SPHI|nr:A/G-specific adenine glycosylase [Mucilaginibacter straminoryzae]MCJ8208303.1 A/G-specific adenine glycosylase [Mucilaginibacter straminoryzae]
MNFNEEIIRWYQANKRDLPWRHTTNPYIIWLSEIILQQTRVEQGLPYFHRFAERFPTVRDFAAASEDEILTLWQGLGYYSRGRNMLVTARLVMELYQGEFPKQHADLIRLKGIGEYTAAAIASFSANEAKAVVDGNVYRVLARYFGIAEPINSTPGKKVFQQLADELLNQQTPGLHNQAMMEFGAMLCKPKNPDCKTCPVREGCAAFATRQVNSLPVKLKKLKVKERFFTYFLYTDGHHILMNRRNADDIWANMCDLPLIETPGEINPYEVLHLKETVDCFGEAVKTAEVLGTHKHVLTHRKLKVSFVRLEHPPIKLKEQWFYIEVENLKKIAMPQIIFIFLTKFFKFKLNSPFYN